MSLQRTFRIHRRDDGRFVTRNESSADSPLGVDLSLNMALGTAHREAVAASREDGCMVVVEVQQADGKWKRHNVVHPPKRA
jgi:hypothetical protein